MSEWTVYKYDIVGPDVIIRMPGGAHVLDVQFQNDTPRLWACVLPEAPLVSRHFIMVGTGQRINVPRQGINHVATVQEGPFVWHVFEVYDQ